MSYSQKIHMILFLGVVMRIGYMLYTQAYVRAHDADEIALDQYGHFSYIYRIYENHRLPETNFWQLYHPPLFHALSAFTMKVVKLFTNNHEVSSLIEASKIVSCFASCATLRITYLICKELELEDKWTCITTAFVAFLPNMYLLSGRINNDSLVVYFMFIIVLYTIRWCKNQSYKNTIILALAFGLGMSTKISCAVLALYTGTAMLVILVKEVRKGKGHGVDIQNKLFCFGAISFPLGLWYPIRNYLLFQQPLNYTPKISITHDLYCGDKGIFARFISIPIHTMFDNLYNRPFEDYNANIYLIKGALFGEFSFDIAKFIPIVLLILYFILLVIALIGMLVAVVRGVRPEGHTD